MAPTQTQTSKLLPRLFDSVEEEQRLAVLHIGAPTGDTLEFFSGFRCRLHIVDLFKELPLPDFEDDARPLEEQFEDILALPPDTRFDICLFWDLFNFLDEPVLAALLRVLQPRLKEGSLAHAFSTHNPRSAPQHNLYGISDTDTLSLRPRTEVPPGYKPFTQNQLKNALNCYRVERSVLLPDSRLEILLESRP